MTATVTFVSTPRTASTFRYRADPSPRILLFPKHPRERRLFPKDPGLLHPSRLEPFPGLAPMEFVSRADIGYHNTTRRVAALAWLTT